MHNIIDTKLCTKIYTKLHLAIHMEMINNTHNKSYQLKLNKKKRYHYPIDIT